MSATSPGYKCVKTTLKKLIKLSSYKQKNVLETINDAVVRTNKIIIKTYLLLRLWILDKYHNNESIPKITENVIKVATKVFISDSKGFSDDDNKIMFENFKQYYNKELFGNLVDGKALFNVLRFYSTTILTSIENNIKNNFTSYLNRYINSYFTKLYETEIEDKTFKKQLFKELKVLKNDLINNTLTCDSKYHKWINDNRSKLVPILASKESIIPDLHTYPQKYIKYMIYVSGELENMEKKQYQFFPLQLSTIPRYIQIDTEVLTQLFETHTSVIKNKKELWKTIFNIKIEDGKLYKGHIFDNCIITDGFAVSIRCIESGDKLKAKLERQAKMQEAKNINNQKIKNCTTEEKKVLRKQFKQEQTAKESKYKEYSKKKFTDKLKQSKKEDIKPKKGKIQYIDDINRDELKGKHIFIDPGKRSLFTMIDDENNYFRYTNRQYLEETKRLKYANKMDRFKTTLGITKKEKILSDFNSKTIDITKFKGFIKTKLTVNLAVMSDYNHVQFRQYKWYAYINKKRALDNLLNKIEKHYSKEHIIIIGDWSVGKQMANYISTPNIGLKRKLCERFRVYNIDEFRTSCINYKTEERCENLVLWFNKKYREMHSILTYKMENNRLGCIDRDKNGCQNIKKLFNCYLNGIEKPEVYRRDYKIEK